MIAEFLDAQERDVDQIVRDLLDISVVLVRKEMRESVYLQAESEFYFADSVRSLMPKQYSYVRLGFAGQSVEAMKQGIKLITEYK